MSDRNDAKWHAARADEISTAARSVIAAGGAEGTLTLSDVEDIIRLAIGADADEKITLAAALSEALEDWASARLQLSKTQDPGSTPLELHDEAVRKAVDVAEKNPEAANIYLRAAARWLDDGRLVQVSKKPAPTPASKKPAPTPAS